MFRLFVAVIATNLWFSSLVSGQVDEGKVLKKDLPYIPCGVCHALVEGAFARVSELRAAAPYQKLSEGEIQDVLDKVCDPKSADGVWIRALDIVEGDDRVLVLEKAGKHGKCRHECKTIAQSCENVVEDLLDNFSSELWKGEHSADELATLACTQWTDVCGKNGRDRKMKESRNRKDYPYDEMTEKDFGMEQMMAELQGMGMGGSMYNRDEMMQDMQGMYGDMDGMDPYGDMGMGGMGGDPYGGYGDMDMGGMGDAANFEL
jgi:hypothetical protein